MISPADLHLVTKRIIYTLKMEEIRVVIIPKADRQQSWNEQIP